MAVQQLLTNEDFIQYVVENMKDKLIFHRDAENTEKVVTILRVLLENRTVDKLIVINRRPDPIVAQRRQIHFKISKRMIDLPNDFIENKALDLFYSKRCAVLKPFVMESPEMQITCIYEDVPDYLWLSTITTMRFIADIFKEQPLSQDEIAMLKALSEEDFSLVNQAIDSFYHRHNIDEFRKRKKVYAFLTQDNDDMCKDLEYSIESVNSSIKNASRTIIDLQNKIKKYEVQLAGLHAEYNRLALSPSTRENKADEIMNFLKENQHVISLKSIGGGSFKVCVNAFLDDYNYDSIEIAVNNKKSVLYQSNYLKKTYGIDLLSKFYKKLFLSGEYKIHSYSEWMIKTNTSPLTIFPLEISICSSGGVMLNPHLAVHTCLGAFRDDFKEEIKNFDIIGILMTMILSSKAINVEEQVSFHYVLDWLFIDLFESETIYDVKQKNSITPHQLMDICEEEKLNEN